MIEVTVSDFAKLAQRRALTPEFLAERFAGNIDRPSEFFHRLFQGQYSAVVIPYASVLTFYTAELERPLDALVCLVIKTQLDFSRRFQHRRKILAVQQEGSICVM